MPNATPDEIWQSCKRSDWMLWLLDKVCERESERNRFILCCLDCIKWWMPANNAALWGSKSDSKEFKEIFKAVEICEGYVKEETPSIEHARLVLNSRAMLYEYIEIISAKLPEYYLAHALWATIAAISGKYWVEDLMWHLAYLALKLNSKQDFNGKMTEIILSYYPKCPRNLMEI